MPAKAFDFAALQPFVDQYRAALKAESAASAAFIAAGAARNAAIVEVGRTRDALHAAAGKDAV